VAVLRLCLSLHLQQSGYELLETHDNAGAIVIVDYMVKMPMGNLQVSTCLPTFYEQNVYNRWSTSAASKSANKGAPLLDAVPWQHKSS
jgi:hypothetical protein